VSEKKEWKFILAFLLGAMFAEFTADPISDWLFFQKSQQGFTGEEAIIYWYYVPAMVYFALFIIALILYKTRFVEPSTFTVVLLAVTAYGTYLSLKIFSFTPLSIILLTLPVLLFAYILLRRREFRA
jgi:hypothetical protein